MVRCDGCSAVFKNNNGARNYHPQSACPHYLKDHPEVIHPRFLQQLQMMFKNDVIKNLKTNPQYKEYLEVLLMQLLFQGEV